MRKNWKRIVTMGLSVVMLASAFQFTGCDKEAEEDTTPFNQGIVNYTKTESTQHIDGYDESKFGETLTKKTDYVDNLYENNFRISSDIDDGITGGEGEVSVVDKSLNIPTNLKKATSSVSWSPKCGVSASEYFAVQMAFDVTFTSFGESNDSGLFIGIYKAKASQDAQTFGDGVWFGFNAKTKNITLFAGTQDNYSWPNGSYTFEGPDAIFAEDAKIEILCADNGTAIFKVSGSQFMKIECANDTITLYDENDKQLYQGALSSSAIAGRYFTFFANNGGANIDNVKMLGAQKDRDEIVYDVTAVPTEGNSLGLDITDKTDLVGICYTMWFNAILGNGTSEITDDDVLNIATLKEKYGWSASEGFGTGNNRINAFHYWGKPAQGYYRSTDKEAAKNNMRLLYKAGVDFVICDYTYATADVYAPGTYSWDTYIEGPSTALLEAIMEMRADGEGTPYVVFWMSSTSMFDYMNEYFISQEKWKDCFTYWDDKPFILAYNYSSDFDSNAFTVRGMTGLKGERNELYLWTYLERDNTNCVYYDEQGNAEQVCCCVACQNTYMSLSTAKGRNGGQTWYEQWQTAFNTHPKFVTITWWNEWTAQLYYTSSDGYVFTDEFSQERSRDIEPMEGGHGDQYYQWLCQYIEAYKAGKDCPELVEK